MCKKGGAIVAYKARLEKIKAASALCEALWRGARMLAVSSHSGRELQRRLRHAGVDEATAAEAVERLRERGLIREESDAVRLAERCVRKGWGPRRVLSELFAKGYGEAAQKEARTYLESVDFNEVCLDVLKKVRVPERSDRAALQKLQASLLRRGFLPSTIREALQAYFER